MTAAQNKMESEAVTLRHLPYPYEAALAICSDLDETPNRHVYWESTRFLNTPQTTSMGPGVGLEVGNSIYFDMHPDQFAYWNTDDTGREMVRTLIHSGHIDFLHSYGDLATTRAHAERALEELNRHGCKLNVWVDHSKAITNFGADIMRGQGDVPSSPAYHADLTCAYGIRFVNRGRATSVIGQNVPARLGGIFTARHPVESSRTLAKEFAKRIVARRDHPKYAIHGPNRVLRDAKLRDGQQTLEFLRCNPYWGGLDGGDTATGIADVLTQRFLDTLVARKGWCVFYTHLGKVRDPAQPFGPQTQSAFRLLADYNRDRRILVTTTRRLLGLSHATENILQHVRLENDGLHIDLQKANERLSRTDSITLSDLQGLSFVVGAAVPARVFVDDREVESVKQCDSGLSGRILLCLPWRRLEFPDHVANSDSGATFSLNNAKVSVDKRGR